MLNQRASYANGGISGAANGVHHAGAGSRTSVPTPVNSFEDITKKYMPELEQAFIKRDVRKIKEILSRTFLEQNNVVGLKKYRIDCVGGALVLYELTEQRVDDVLLSYHNPRELTEYRRQIVKKPEHADALQQPASIQSGQAAQKAPEEEIILFQPDLSQKQEISSKSIFYDFATHMPAVRAIVEAEEKYSKLKKIPRMIDQIKSLDNIEDSISEAMREFDSRMSNIEGDAKRKGIDNIIADTMDLIYAMNIKITRDRVDSMPESRKRDYYSMVASYQLMEKTQSRLRTEWAKIHSSSTREVGTDSIILLDENSNKSVEFQKRKLKSLSKFLIAVSYIVAHPSDTNRYTIRGLSEDDINMIIAEQSKAFAVEVKTG